MKRRAAVVLACALGLATVASPLAQRRNRNDNSAQGAPVATNAIVDAPDRYYGKLVTVSAGVDKMLSKTTFLLDQRKADGRDRVKAVGKPILVIAPHLTEFIDPWSYLQVRGEVTRLDAASLERLAPGYTLDLAPEISARYLERPVLVANSVINSRYMELAKKPEGTK
jgi:hypothetical protein